MRATIVIPHFEPSYSEPGMLERTIDSVLKTTNDIEIIVVDGGSTIETRTYLANWKIKDVPLGVVLLTDNRGFTKHVNIGIRLSLAPLIVLLNSDVTCEAGWLDAIESALKEDPQVGIVGCQIRDMVDTNQIVHGGAVGPAQHKLGYADDGDFQERTFDDDYLTFCCVGIRKDVIDQIGLLDEQFIIHGSDSDFCYRARSGGWKLCYEPKAIIYHEQEGTLRHMRGKGTINTILAEDQRRHKKKWEAHLSQLGHPSESALQAGEVISLNTGSSQVKQAG